MVAAERAVGNWRRPADGCLILGRVGDAFGGSRGVAVAGAGFGAPGHDGSSTSGRSSRPSGGP